MRFLVYCTLAVLFLACKPRQGEKNVAKAEVERPNILWITCEDISPTLSIYGDSTALTPNLDALASESLVYEKAYSVVGVCAPSRSAIVTGMYPTSMGTMHMRTGKDVIGWGTREYAEHTDGEDIAGNPIREYAAVIPEYVKCFPEFLRKVGYFTSNNPKTDYQFAAPVTAWDENGRTAHWRHKKDGQPFFAVFNIEDTHESKIWKYSDRPLTVSKDSVTLPAYYQDTQISREDVARNYSNIEIMDKKVGEIIAQLKQDGLYDNTIIFFYSDHGGPLLRGKREIYESGLHVPFMVKDLKGTTGRTDRMISFVDLAPTILSLANVEIPGYMEGRAFMGGQEETPRQYVYGSSDRFDEFSDRSRAVYDQQYLYIINDFPDKTWYKDVSYRKQIPMMREMLTLRDAGKLNATQMKWFQTRPQDELYDVVKDPQTLHNLAGEAGFENVRKRLRSKLLEFRDRYQDYGMMPESQLIAQMWPGNKQPVTHAATIDKKGENVVLNCSTKGASIGYILSDKPLDNLDFDSGWQVYDKPLEVKKGQYIYVMTQRIGFRESGITSKAL